MITHYRAEIERAAERHHLEPNLVEGLILVESSGNRYAARHEAGYRYLWDVRTKRPFRKLTLKEIGSPLAPDDFPCLAGSPDQEWTLQRTSLGLMQIMGAVARERGFQEPYLTQMCEVGYNLEYGCSLLEGLMIWAKGDVTVALAAYNGGKKNNQPGGPLQNASYADKVLRMMEQVIRARFAPDVISA